MIFFIGAIAETNRAPFDLAEAESELVSGFMTEHSAVIFVFFFLAEYASIVLICIITTILFMGGYNLDIDPGLINYIVGTLYAIISEIGIFIYYVFDTLLVYLDLYVFNMEIDRISLYTHAHKFEAFVSNDGGYDINKDTAFFENLMFSLILGTKSLAMIFVFIWVRASFPRIRFDQLMSYC